jgi:hypothetical protein
MNNEPYVPDWRSALVIANASPRCGAKCRDGHPCKGPAMLAGRCRIHGGRSTGPRTAEGLERSRKANWRHGLRSALYIGQRREAAASMRFIRQMLAAF